MYAKIKGQDYYTNRHSCFLLQYHMVFVTKYRKPILTGDVKDKVYSLIRETMEERGLNLMELNGEPDHVHLLFEADPFTSVGELANVLKSKTSRYTRQLYADTLLKPYYWKPYFWSGSYFVVTVSERSAGLVQEYIRNQSGS